MVMTAKEAYDIFVKEYKHLVVKSCYEYDTVFVFLAEPQKYVNTAESGRVYDSLYSVNKKNGKCGGFNPMHLSDDEYNRGKKRLIPELQKHTTTVRKE
jgi:hypothetical protein